MTSNKNIARGKRFLEVCQTLFPGQARAEIGQELSVSGGTVRNIEMGHSISAEVMTRLEALGVSLKYLLNGEGEVFNVSLPGLTGLSESTQLADTDEDFPPPADSSQERIPETKLLALIIGANLRHLRKKMFPGWGGQKKFAKYLGLAANDLCVYEYGRIVPNEARQEEIAKKLDLSVAQLRSPLPGVVITPKAPKQRMPSVSAWHNRTEELQRVIARMEGRIEILQNELRCERERADRLQEANILLRHLLYGSEETPELRTKREQITAGLGPAIADLIRNRDQF